MEPLVENHAKIENHAELLGYRVEIRS